MFSGALPGMTKAESLLDSTVSGTAAASRAASGETTQVPADTVELTDQMTSLIQALTAFETGSEALEVEASLAESTLHITA